MPPFPRVHPRLTSIVVHEGVLAATVDGRTIAATGDGLPASLFAREPDLFTSPTRLIWTSGRGRGSYQRVLDYSMRDGRATIRLALPPHVAVGDAFVICE